MKRPKKLPNTLTPIEQEMLVSKPNERYLSGIRAKAMLRLMLDCGLRSAEVLSLRDQDVDLATGQIRVQNGKGGRDRVLWTNQGTLEYLRKWRERRGQESNFLFCTRSGRKIDSSYLRRLVYRLASKAGISKKISPHTLRHTFASDLLRQSGSLLVVQRALGHSDLQTTSIYLHLADGELENALKSLRRGE